MQVGTKYRTIVADPPWPVVGDSDALFRPWCAKGGRRARGLQQLSLLAGTP